MLSFRYYVAEGKFLRCGCWRWKIFVFVDMVRRGAENSIYLFLAKTLPTPKFGQSSTKNKGIRDRSWSKETTTSRLCEISPCSFPVFFRIVSEAGLNFGAFWCVFTTQQLNDEVQRNNGYRRTSNILNRKLQLHAYRRKMFIRWLLSTISDSNSFWYANSIFAREGPSRASAPPIGSHLPMLKGLASWGS